jgi:signal transduction histidine kinase
VAGDEALAQAIAASAILIKEQAALVHLDSRGSIDALAGMLTEYQSLLRAYRLVNPPLKSDEEAVRQQGHKISQAADGLVIQERKALADSVSASQWALALFTLILAIVVVALGRWLSRRVVAPLRRLPQDLQPIAEGRLQSLNNRYEDAEIVAYTQAFNRMLDELDSRRRRLVQSEKLAALGVLVAGVAHEVNNPLSNISSSCQLLIEELDDAPREQLLEWAATIDSETERARTIVAALMEYGRRREAERVPVSLSELVSTTLLLLKGPMRSAGGRVEADIPEDLVVMGDPQRLQQVFINLLRNGVESGENVTVRVTAHPCGDEINSLPDGVEVVGEPNCHRQASQQVSQIVITDNGRGIPAEDLSHVFEPFYSKREAGQGMGLGLYIVQEIIQEHDGCIAIGSDPHQGTRIFLRLPCAGGDA